MWWHLKYAKHDDGHLFNGPLSAAIEEAKKLCITDDVVWTLSFAKGPDAIVESHKMPTVRVSKNKVELYWKS